MQNEESMYGRAWSNPQLSMEPKVATRRRAAARADKDEMDNLNRCDSYIPMARTLAK